MISLDLMKSSEVRIAGDWSNYVAVVISKWARLTCFIKWLFSIPNIFWGRWHIYWLFHRFFFTLSNILQHAFVFHICFLLFREHNTYVLFQWWMMNLPFSTFRWAFCGKTSASGENFIGGKIPSNQVRGDWCQTASHYHVVGWRKTGTT